MAPPAIAALAATMTLQECGDFQLTAARHLPQLQDFFQNFLQSATSLESIERFYVTTNPLVTAFAFSLFLAPVFLVASEINKNYSQVDRCWSILPSVYTIHYALWTHAAGLPCSRVDLLLGVTLTWSTRLTFNYWRKGGYSIGSEDYRWSVLQNYISPALFFIFNVTFISLAQSLLLFLITTPVYVLLLATRITGDKLSTSDIVYACLMLGAVVVSAIADQQQWNFQETKYLYRKTAKVPPGYKAADLDRGFRVTGLFAWSRHPNFAAEQTFWVLLYQWCCFETYTYFNWTFAGAMGYLLLFQASTWFTEMITANKYSEYKVYQERVSKFLPKFSTFLTGPVPVEEVPRRKQGTSKGAADGKKSS